LSNLVSKLNSTATEHLLDTAYSSQTANSSDIHAVEQLHLEAFKNASSVIKNIHSGLHSKALQEAKDSLSQAKSDAIEQAQAILSQYKQLMSILVAYPTTEAEIRNASDTAITISLGANTDPRYVTALQSQAAPIISMHIQARWPFCSCV